MKIEYGNNRLTILYDSYENENNNIKKVHFNFREDDEIGLNGFCQVFSKSEDVISEFPTVCKVVEHTIYGTPISPDGKYLFIGTWDKGLFCYDIDNRNLKWKKTPAKVRQVIAKDEFLVIEMCDRGIYKRHIETGELLSEIKMSNIRFMYRISDNEIFTGTKRDKYFIYEIPSLTEKSVMKKSSLTNINIYEAINILDAKKENGKLVISGTEFEYSSEDAIDFTRSIKIP
ncbi:hypothetical protein ABDB91_07435 [Desulfoscipio sp. XC116]|uniref:hypothetical protein n=1 Tax=Desulfoscipio sp. XC116 TaxID=3144975 RepID=UPI00325B7DA3